MMPVSMDFNERPFLVIWETTHACDLACLHCRASADPLPARDELTPNEGLDLVKQVKDLGVPILIFSGGDPLKRKDLTDLISYGKSLGLRVGTIPAVTPLLTKEKIYELKNAGLDQIAFSLDAATADVHDSFRRVDGVFRQTLESIRIAKEAGLAVQVNSLVNIHNQEHFDELIDLVKTLGIVFWEVFFLVPVGRGTELPLLSAERFDDAFKKIYELHREAPFIIKITEAPHYRQFYIEQQIKSEGLNLNLEDRRKLDLPAYFKKVKGPKGSVGRAPAGVNAGKGFVFISHRGEVMPSGFLPLAAGNLRQQSLKEIYQDSFLFKNLRDSSLLKGRCGLCPYRDICGGSRSRAYALTGDYLAEDPCCSFQMEAFQALA